MYSLKSMCLFALVAILCLSGARCVIVAGSGGSSSHAKPPPEEKPPPEPGIIIVTSSGRLSAPVAEGVHFVSGSTAGFTTDAGEFEYEPRTGIAFFIGDIQLGAEVAGKSQITTLDFVPGSDIETRAVINIVRFLQSLDAVPGDDRITIPRQVHHDAVVSNTAVTAAIESLDFSDENAFINAASQLIAVLTADYPFTASLVDADTARARLRLELQTLDSQS